MATDPICGMTVNEASSLRVERNGQTFYFCSEHCREKFVGQNHPTQPAAATTEHDVHVHQVVSAKRHVDHEHSDHGHGAATVTPSAGAKYFCPMCPGVESDQPGDCPKCGMALERNPACQPPAAGNVIYTCPMHPEVQQDHPGNC